MLEWKTMASMGAPAGSALRTRGLVGLEPFEVVGLRRLMAWWMLFLGVSWIVLPAQAFPVNEDSAATEAVATEGMGSEVPSAETHPWQGWVLDPSGQPIAGASVTVETRAEGVDSSTSILSDASGGFPMSMIAPRQLHVLEVGAQGFGTERLEVHRLEVYRLDTATDPPPLEITLYPGRPAAGRVVDLDGQPIAGATVELRHRRVDDFGGSVVGARDLPYHVRALPWITQSDAQGRFHLPGVTVGQHTLALKAEGYAPLTVPQVTVPPVMVPPVAARGGAVASETAPSKTVPSKTVPSKTVPPEDGAGVEPPPADLGTAVLAPGASIRGRLVDPAGNPVPGASLKWTRLGLDGERGGAVTTVESQGDGTFQLDDLPHDAEVNLRVEATGFQDRRLPRVPAGVEDLEIVLDPAAFLEGRVVDTDGQGVPKVRVLMIPEGSGQNAAVRASGVDGAFVFDDLIPGTYRLTGRTQHGEIQSVLRTVEVGVVGEPVLLVLETRPVLRGHVVDDRGEPLAKVRIQVVLPGTEEAPRFSSSRLTDAAGWYEITHLRAGVGTLGASRPGFESVEIDLALDGRMETVRDLEIRRLPGHRLFEVRGEVRATDGSAVPRAKVQALPIGPLGDRPHATRAVFSGTAGEFRLELEGAGGYRITAKHPDFSPWRQDFEFEDSVDGLEILLERGGAVEGTIEGLPDGALERLHVMANRLGDAQRGVVTPDGRYVIEPLAVASWQVTAWVPGSGWQLDGQVTVEGQGDRARLDFTFEPGVELHGRVTLDGEPLVSAKVVSVCDTPPVQGASQTAFDGRFVIEGMSEGVCVLRVTHRATGAGHQRAISIRGGQGLDVDLRSARLTGRVTGSTAAPVANAWVKLYPAVAGRLANAMSQRRTDTDGRFDFGTMTQGSWRVVVEVGGHPVAEQTLDVITDAMELALVVPDPAR